jgi:hypothetical protein
VLYPVKNVNDGNGSGPATGFDIEHTSVVNRAPGKPIPSVGYDKLRASGVIVDELGPDTFLAEIRKIWEENTPHLLVATLLDWFASYVYLPRLRDDVTLTNAIEKLVARIDSPVAFAERFDETTGAYYGVSECSLGLTDVANGFFSLAKGAATARRNHTR